jgi:hypothetical protein
MPRVSFSCSPLLHLSSQTHRTRSLMQNAKDIAIAKFFTDVADVAWATAHLKQTRKEEEFTKEFVALLKKGPPDVKMRVVRTCVRVHGMHVG